MFIYKALSAIAAAAFGAALVLALPGFSPEVEARTPPPVVKSDRLDIQPAAPACDQQAWPYYDGRLPAAPQRPDPHRAGGHHRPGRPAKAPKPEFPLLNGRAPPGHLLLVRRSIPRDRNRRAIVAQGPFKRPGPE